MKLETFLQWLRDLGAERRFLSCYWREPRRRLRLATYLRITPEADWIKCAFIWHDTPEGNRYWHDINRNYQKLLSNNGQEKINTARMGDIHVASQSAPHAGLMEAIKLIKSKNYEEDNVRR